MRRARTLSTRRHPFSLTVGGVPRPRRALRRSAQGGNMSAARNRQVLLAARPRGEPTPDDFRLVEPEVPEPGPGQALLRTVYLSLDPYMRGRMRAGPSYAPPVEVGAVMEGGTVCEVVKSNLP